MAIDEVIKVCLIFTYSFYDIIWNVTWLEELCLTNKNALILVSFWIGNHMILSAVWNK